ncbi:MAG TPA: CorA family divalent cation transporter [Nakamurella sp.]|nr:CorA family divalent cation transporter [Nakamurella sp.]
MIVDCAVYREGRRLQAEAMPLAEAARQRDTGAFVWVGTFDPTPAEHGAYPGHLRLARPCRAGRQEVPPPAEGRAVRRRRAAGLLRTARYDDDREEIDFGEISVFLSPGFVITVRQGVASELRGALARLERRPELLESGSDSARWAILDQVVDGYAPMIGEFERDIEQLESTVFSGAVAPTERIYFLRREVTNFYRAVHPLLAVVANIERSVPEQLLPYLQDVHDNLALVNEEVAAQRDLLTTVLEANISGDLGGADQDQRAAEFDHRAADQVVHGVPAADLRHRFFGHNFGWLVDNICSLDTFLVFGVGALVIPCVALLVWFRMTARRRAQVITSSDAPMAEAIPD